MCRARRGMSRTASHKQKQCELPAWDNCSRSQHGLAVGISQLVSSISALVISSMRRLIKLILGYACSAAIASGFYIFYLGLTTSSDPDSEHVSLEFKLAFWLFFSVFGGFIPALGLMIVPWLIAVLMYRRVSVPGWIYYPAIGAVSTTLIGCATWSLAPKPLFVEDQTFVEDVITAAESQGVCTLFAGLLFGISFWFLSGRRPLALQHSR